jgi:hypothetical protein
MNQEQKQLEHLEHLEQLEREGERKVAALIDVSEQALVAIIDEGNDAFKAVHGRNMTYAEMRGLYG